MIQTNIPALQTILEKAQPLVEKRTVDYIANYNIKMAKNNEAYAIQKATYDTSRPLPRGVNRIMFMQELKQWQIEDYKFNLTFDMVKAFGRYIKKDDVLKSFTLNTSGAFTIDCVIVRDGVDFNMETDVIPAGGYNIQCFHYRYIVKTKLPSFDAKPLVQRISKTVKYAQEMQNLLSTLERYEAAQAARDGRTFEDFFKNESQYGRRTYYAGSGQTEEEYQAYNLEQGQREYKFYMTQYVKYSKDVKKNIAKLETKIAEL